MSNSRPTSSPHFPVVPTALRESPFNFYERAYNRTRQRGIFKPDCRCRRPRNSGRRHFERCGQRFWCVLLSVCFVIPLFLKALGWFAASKLSHIHPKKQVYHTTGSVTAKEPPRVLRSRRSLAPTVCTDLLASIGSIPNLSILKSSDPETKSDSTQGSALCRTRRDGERVLHRSGQLFNWVTVSDILRLRSILIVPYDRISAGASFRFDLLCVILGSNVLAIL